MNSDRVVRVWKGNASSCWWSFVSFVEIPSASPSSISHWWQSCMCLVEPLHPERRTGMLKGSCERLRCFFLFSRLGLWIHINQTVQHQASQHFRATAQSNQVPPSSTFMFQMCSFEWYLTINYHQLRTKVDMAEDLNFNIVELVVFGWVWSHL